MSLSPFLISFYVTYVNSGVTTVVTTRPTPPVVSTTSFTDTNNIQSLINYVSTNGVNLGTLGFINNSISSIVASFSGTSSSTVSSQLTTLPGATSSKQNLITSLTNLKKSLSSAASTSTLVLPTETDGTAPSASGGVIPIKTYQTSKVTKFTGLGTKVEGIQTNSVTVNSSYNTFIGKVQAAVTSIVNGTAKPVPVPHPHPHHRHPRPRPRPIPPLFAEVIPTTVPTSSRDFSRPFDKSCGAPNGVPNNFFNNVAKAIFGTANTGTCKDNAAIIQLIDFKGPTDLVDPTQTTTVVEATDFYEVSTSVQNGFLIVTYAYYSANSTSSSFACTFSLSPQSVISLSGNAYKNVLTLPGAEKTKLCTAAGINTSSPSNSDMWASYLIWMFSYLSLGVSSQLGLNNVNSFPGVTTGSVNYMLNNGYLEAVGNFGVTLETTTMDSDIAGLVSVAIPNLWPTLMYSIGTVALSGSQSKYQANVISTMMQKQTTTTIPLKST